MSTIASRDLRNHTRSVLDQVAAGDTVTVTVNGRVVAQIGPPSGTLRTHLTKAEVEALVLRGATRDAPLDATLVDDLAWISAGSSNELDDLA